MGSALVARVLRQPAFHGGPRGSLEGKVEPIVDASDLAKWIGANGAKIAVEETLGRKRIPTGDKGGHGLAPA